MVRRSRDTDLRFLRFGCHKSGSFQVLPSLAPAKSNLDTEVCRIRIGAVLVVQFRHVAIFTYI